MAVADEFLEGLMGVVRAGGVLVVLNAVDFDAAVVFREGLEVLPGLLVGTEGVKDPFFENEELGIERRCYRQARGCVCPAGW